jgi:hypothetical protein
MPKYHRSASRGPGPAAEQRRADAGTQQDGRDPAGRPEDDDRRDRRGVLHVGTTSRARACSTRGGRIDRVIREAVPTRRRAPADIGSLCLRQETTVE